MRSYTIPFVSCLLLAAPSLLFAELYTIPLVPHHVQQRRQRSLGYHEEISTPPRRREEALQVGALYQGYGTHYVDLWVGTPNPQRQTVIVDTGSGVTAFPCSGCGDCGDSYHLDEYFVEADSETFEAVPCGQCMRGSCRNNQCSIGMSYQEGSSWSAYEAKDIVYAGGLHERAVAIGDEDKGDDIDPHHASALQFKLDFGCQTKITGLFKTQMASGIMGMDNADTSYWSQMHAAGVLKEQSFALCYSRPPTSERGGTEAGALTFGGADTRLHSSPMVYSGGHKGRIGFFSVKLKKIYLREGSAGESASASTSEAKILQLDISEQTLSSSSVIVDSGTTDTYFSRTIDKAFQAAYTEMTGKQYSHDAMELTAEQLAAMPTILFQIEGDVETNQKLYGEQYVTGLANALDTSNPYDVILALPPSHYMEYDPKKGKYIARFYTDEGGGSVLGGNAIMGHDVFFDIDGGNIGWAESNCDYTTLVAEYGFDLAPQADSKKEQTGEPTNDEPTKAEPTNDETEHEVDTPTDITVKPSSPSSPYPAVAVCSGTTCRAGVFAAMAVVLVVGIFVGRAISRRPAVRYHGTELEVPNLHLDEDDEVDFSPRYRDNPEGQEDIVGGEGVGYEEDDELDAHEIA